MELSVKNKPKKVSIDVMNAFKRSATVEHLVKNHNCAKLYEISKFKISWKFSNVFTDLIKPEVTSTHSKKSKLWQQE